MGRKKKKVVKPWCWYCNRDFEDDKILIQHQKAKHFKCHICYKKLYTGPGLAVHCQTVHKETIDKVPNSLPNRGSLEIEIYGMEGIPEEDMKKHEAEITGRPVDEEPPSKKLAIESVGMPHGLPIMPPMMPGSRPPLLSTVGMPLLPGMPPLPYGMPPVVPPIAPIPGILPGMPTLPSVSGLGMVPNLTAVGIASMNSAVVSSIAQANAFPAFSTSTCNPAVSSIVPTAVVSADKPALITASTGTKIMHPDEDISLEEHRAKFRKYAVSLVNQESASSTSNNDIRPNVATTFTGQPYPPMPVAYGYPPMTTYVNPAMAPRLPFAIPRPGMPIPRF